MRSGSEAEWRLAIARQHLDEAERALADARPIAAADQARKAVENALKAAIACYQPAPRTHEPDKPLADLLQAAAVVPAALRADVAALIPLGRRHGFVEHIRLAYGEEETRRTPLDFATPAAAQAAVADAREAVRLSAAVVAAQSWPSA